MSIQKFRFCFLFLFLALFGCTEEGKTVQLQFVTPSGEKTPAITAEVANTEGLRRRGLMYRKDLPDNHGMLFVFPDETQRQFWMKDTYMELDIIFLDKDKRVVSVIERALPLSEKPRESQKPASFAVEVRGGLAKKWGLVPGSVIAIDDSEVNEPLTAKN